MPTKRYGPTDAPGVVIIEKESQKAITKGALGTTGYAGILERGPVLDAQGNLALITCPDKRSFTKQCGGAIDESQCPTAVDDFFDAGEGAGSMLLARVTDGTEVPALRNFLPRQEVLPINIFPPTLPPDLAALLNNKTFVAGLTAKNGGRWGGRDRLLGVSIMPVDPPDEAELLIEDNSIITNGEIEMLEDEWKGAWVTLADAPNKSFKVIGNTASDGQGGQPGAGVITVETDTGTLFGHLVRYASALPEGDTTWYATIKLSNDVESGLHDKGLDIVIKDGIEDAVNMFGMDVYLDGSLVKSWPNLSLDQTSAYYAPRVINEDRSNYWVAYEDMHLEAPSAAARPANVHQVFLGCNGNEAWINPMRGVDGEIADSNANAVAIPGYIQRLLSRMNWLTSDPGVGDAIAAFIEAMLGETDPAAESIFDSLGYGNDMQPLKVVFECVDAVYPAQWSVKTYDFYTGVQVHHGLPNLTEGQPYSWPDETLCDYILPNSGDGVFTVGDHIEHYWQPLRPHKYVDGAFYPDADNNRRLKVRIVDNDFDTITAKDSVNFREIALVSDACMTVEADSGNSASSQNLAFGWFGISIADDLGDIHIECVAPGMLNTAMYQFFDDDGNVINMMDSTGPWTMQNFIDPGVPEQSPICFLADMTGRIAGVYWIDDSEYGPTYNVEVGDRWTMRFTGKTSSLRIEAGDGLRDGYDGVAGVDANDYADRFDVDESAFNKTVDKGLGLIKFAIPGVEDVIAQKAAKAYAEAKNHQFRAEIPVDIVDESLAEAWVNETFGRSDMCVTSFPSHVVVPDSENADISVTQSATGLIHGVEAKYARNYNGYHKAQADIFAALPKVIDLPTGDKALNQELLNRHGIGMIIKKHGNYVLWGDRTLWLDPAWMWKHQREQMSYYEHDLQEKFDWIVFMINDAETRDLAITAVKSYFMPEWAKRAVRGATFEDAVSIKCDDENNTDLTMALGDMNMEIALRLADTVERFIITMSKAGIFDAAS